MSLSKRDAVATGLVAVAVVLYVLWAVGSPPAVLTGTRATGVVILVLGFLASASAVAPGFDGLLHGNKAYLSVIALIGLVAAVAGVTMLLNASSTALAVMMVAMVVLWLIATIHHSYLATGASSAPERESPQSHDQPACADSAKAKQVARLGGDITDGLWSRGSSLVRTSADLDHPSRA